MTTWLAPISTDPPEPPSWAPVPGHPRLLSDTPILAEMVLSDWRDLARVMVKRVHIRPSEEPVPDREPLLPDVPKALEASAVHDPERTPAWVKMREEWLAEFEGGDADDAVPGDG